MRREKTIRKCRTRCPADPVTGFSFYDIVFLSLPHRATDCYKSSNKDFHFPNVNDIAIHAREPAIQVVLILCKNGIKKQETF